MSQPFIIISMKRTENFDVGPPLRSFLNSHYSQTQVQENTDYIDKLAQLRAEIQRVDGARHENTMTLMYEYLTYLRAAGTAFPFDRLKLKFSWYDAIKTTKKAVHSDAHFEEAGVLFNLGAFFSQLAAQQLRTTPEGLKKAAHYFQTAAGLFTRLRDEILSVHILSPLTVDLSMESMTVIINIMLAQAQECFYEKAVNDGLKPGLIAKLCAQTAEYYGIARSNLLGDKLKSHFDKSWVQQVELRFVYFKSVEQQKLSSDLHENDETGDEISRLTHANEVINTALKAHAKTGNSITVSAIQAIQSAIQRALQIAIKENNTIYHHRVRPFNELPPSAKVSTVKPIVPPELDKGVDGPDPFGTLVPLGITQGCDTFQKRFKDMFHQQLAIMQQQTDIYNSTLASLELPHSVEALSTPNAGLPPELSQKIDAIRTQGGLGRLSELFTTVGGLAASGSDAIGQIRKKLGDEEQEDSELKARFGAKWNRIPSSSANAKLTDELTKLQNHLNHAASSDQMVRGKFESRKINLEQLDRPAAELDALLPPAVPPTGPIADAVEALQATINVGAEMVKGRQILEEESKSILAQVKDGIVAEVQTGIKEGRSADSVFEDKTNLYRAWEKRCKENLAQQNTHIEKLKEEKTALASVMSDSESARQRGSALKQLNATVADYNEVAHNIREGIEFYTEFSDIVRKLDASVSDWVFARQTERKDLMAVIQQSITSQLGDTSISKDGPSAPAVETAPSQQQYSQPVVYSQPARQAQPPPATANRFDPQTGQPINQPPAGGAKFDPMTGQPIQQAPPQQPAARFDPQTGQPIPPPQRFDPMTGQPLPRFDPQTGQPLN